VRTLHGTYCSSVHTTLHCRVQCWLPAAAMRATVMVSLPCSCQSQAPCDSLRARLHQSHPRLHFRDARSGGSAYGRSRGHQSQGTQSQGILSQGLPSQRPTPCLETTAPLRNAPFSRLEVSTAPPGGTDTEGVHPEVMSGVMDVLSWELPGSTRQTSPGICMQVRGSEQRAA